MMELRFTDGDDDEWVVPIAKVEVLNVGPGDTLVWTTPSGLPQDRIARLMEQIEDAFPGRKVILKSANHEIQVVRDAK